MKKSVVEKGNPLIQTSMMTSLGLIQGEVLTYLSKRGIATQEQLIEALNWPSVLVTMSVGALVREGLVRAKPFNGELVVFEETPAKDPQEKKQTSAPSDAGLQWEVLKTN